MSKGVTDRSQDKGQVEFFSTWVEEQTKHPLPVLRFDMSGLNAKNSCTLEEAIREAISRTAREHNVNIYSKTLNGMFIDLLVEIYKTQGQAVVLINEYDKPILDNLTDLARANEMREVLRSFYTTLKSCDKYLRFVMLTGISKFSKMGVFSAMNNLLDISMMTKYGDMVGYTQEELEDKFSVWIDNTS